MNKLFTKPTHDDIKVISDYFTTSADYDIALDQEDFNHSLINCENAVVLESREYGADRLPRAFAEIEKEYANLVKGGNVFNSNRCIIQLSYSEAEPVSINETLAISDFVSNLPENSDVIWGIAKEALPAPFTISLKVVFANL